MPKIEAFYVDDTKTIHIRFADGHIRPANESEDQIIRQLASDLIRPLPQTRA